MLIALVGRTAIFAVMAAFFAGLPGVAQTAQSVTLRWDANPEPDVAGYRVYYGTSSGKYSQSNDVGNVTGTTISNLTAGQTYYFVVTDYDTSGLESLPSNEVAYSVPSPTPTPTPTPTRTPTPAPTPTPDLGSTPPSGGTPTPAPGATATPEPAVTPSPTPEPTVTPSPTPEPTSTPIPTPTPTPDPNAAPTPEPTTTPAPTPDSNATHTADSNATPPPDPNVTPTPSPEPSATPERSFWVNLMVSSPNGADFADPADLTLTATASDNNGSITQVEYYNGNRKVGQAGRPPYLFTWKGVHAGTYNLTAVAVDNHHATATSNPVTVSVAPKPGP
jgi:hypothetical protein